MGRVDFANRWVALDDLKDRVGPPEVVPHEETDLHRIFCGEDYCIDREPQENE